MRAALRAAALVGLVAALTEGCGGSASAPNKPDAGVGGRTDAASDSGGSAGSGGSASGGTTGSGGNIVGSGGAGGGTDGSASDTAGEVGGEVATNCLVRLIPLSVQSFFEEVEAGPMAVFRVRAEAIRPGPRSPKWTWRVTDAAFLPVATAAVGGDPATVEFAIKTPGDYTVQAELDSGVFCTLDTKVAKVIPARPASFTVRVIPPEASGIPAQDKRIEVSGAGFSPTILDLLSGQTVTLAAYDAADVRVPAYVRISSAASSVSIEGHTARRPVSAILLPLVTYDVLLVPDAAFAPLLRSDPPGSLSRPIVLDAGTPVTGRVRDGAGRPVLDARVVLRAGSRPSTVGRSDGTGAFELLTRSGTMSAEVNAPDGSGLPNLRVPPSPGIVLPEGADLDLTVSWAALTTAPVRISVLTADGTTAVAGAVVRVESAAPAGASSVGQLLVKVVTAFGPTEVSLPASGAVKVEALSGATGLAALPALPVGGYRVTVVPPAAMAAAMIATTTVAVELPAAGLTRAIRLPRKIKMSGTLLPAAATAGVRITAIDDDTRTSTTATAGAGGRYELLLDPGRSYQLLAQPTTTQPLGRAVIGKLTTGTGDGVIPDRTVPRGIAFDGRIASGGTPLGGVLLQIFCVAGSATCLDQNQPVADTISAVDGTVHVMLPDPRAPN